MKKLFTGRTGLIVTGVIVGVVAIILQMMGNPKNMGFCMACFERDTAGAIGLHSAAIVQYIRPEIIGLVLGAMLVAMMRGEFKPRSGSNSIIRFFLGMFAMIGALVFLGCPWRAFLRLAGGDFNAIIGIVGLVVGVGIGSYFVRRGYNLSTPNKEESKYSGYVMPLFFIALLLMLVLQFSPIKFSESGPGSMHAPLYISLGLAVLVGALAQMSRFCTVGAIRNLFVTKNLDMFWGVLSFFVVVLGLNFLIGGFNPGFEGQPIAHTNHFANFLGMVLSGFAFVLAGGCPGRQLIMVGEGSSDAGIFVLGMIVGGGLSHNFMLASSPVGATNFGITASIIGLIFCFILALVMTKKKK